MTVRRGVHSVHMGKQARCLGFGLVQSNADNPDGPPKLT